MSKPEPNADVQRRAAALIEKVEALRRINRFQTERFGAFLQRLAATPAEGGDLLSQSMIVLASAIGDGDRHNHDNLPVVLAGSGAGKVRGGRHLVVPRNTPMANLYLAIQHAMGVPGAGFADSTGALAIG